jgi:ribulose-phosphate 3-epimerase
MVQETAEIIPAIMPQSAEDLRDKLGRVAKLVPIVQIDVCDGHFTLESTWPYNERDMNSFERILAEDDGLPFWDVVNFEIDMMVGNPAVEMEKWVRSGAQRIVLHYESADPEVIFKLLSSLKDQGVEASLALNVDTAIDVVEYFIDTIDAVQLMGIAQIGFQGQPFDERTIERVAELRELYPDLVISIDGGMNEKSVPRVFEAGANRIVMGSAIFNSPDVEATLGYFESLLY